MAKYKKEDRTIPQLVVSKPEGQEFQTTSHLLDVDNYNCFGVSGKDNRLLSLKVLFSNGGIVLIQYGRMSSPITYDSNKKMIAIEATTMRLEITGSNLVPLLDYIGEQRLAWIKSAGIDGETDVFMMENGEPEIRSIRIHPKSGNS